MKKLSWKRRLVSNVFTSVCMLLIALTVWLPDYLHFRITPDTITPALVQISRGSPPDGVLKQVAEMDLMGLTMDEELRSRIARQVLNGFVDEPVYAEQKVVLQGWPGDLHVQAGIHPLLLAGLSLESLLLQAYERTRQPAYLDLAKQRIIQFIRFEVKASPPIGLIWNDHAIASRVSVLVRLWLHLRANPETTTQEQFEILEAVQRSAEYLAKDSHFTVQTNHGIMQNIALLQLSLAFPELSQSKHWKNKAFDRFYQQLGFYASTEGVILEHSPGYHLFGLRLLEKMLILHAIAGKQPSSELKDIYPKAVAFLTNTLREDCSLPLVGNTSGRSRSDLDLSGDECNKIAQIKQKLGDQNFERIYPISGYAIWGDGKRDAYQTFIAWANFDHHPHKHADEPSIHFWAKNIEWLTGIGYWPYDTQGHDAASGWGGANAPHAENESEFSQRTSRLLFSGSDSDLKVADIETKRADGFAVRRQAIQLNSSQLVVLDFASNAPADVLTNWIFGPYLDANAVSDTELMVTGENGANRLRVQAFTDEQSMFTSSLFAGSKEPLLGWTVVDQKPLATAAWQVRRSGAKHATGTLFSLSPAPERATRPAFVGTVSADNWTVEVRAELGPMVIRRKGSVLTVVSSADKRTVRLLPGPPVDADRAALAKRMSAAMQEYPRWRDLGKYRNRVVSFVLAAWLALLAIPYFIGGRPKLFVAFNVSVALASVCASLWLHLVYFV